MPITVIDDDGFLAVKHLCVTIDNLIGLYGHLAYNLEDEAEFKAFAQGEQREIAIYGTKEKILCDTRKRLGIAVSHIGTSVATTTGAYCYALHNLK